MPSSHARPLRRALKEESMPSEEGEFEIKDETSQGDRRRGMQRSRSMGNRRGGPSRAARSSGGASVSSNSTCRTRSKSNNRSRSTSVGRMSTHRQRSRASMASPSKYGRGLRRDSKDNVDLDASRRSLMTSATDDLSDEPSPLPEGDDDSNHHLRQRLTAMTEVASVPSPSNYRQRKQRLRNKLSNDSIEAVSKSSMSPGESEGSNENNMKEGSAEIKQMPNLDNEDEGPSVHSETIDRQARKEQAALEEVMSMVAKSKKSSRKSRGIDASDRSVVSASRSGIPSEMASPKRLPADRSIRRTQSLNAGSNRPSNRRYIKGGRETMSQKKERRDMVKSNLGMFVEDDH